MNHVCPSVSWMLRWTAIAILATAGCGGAGGAGGENATGVRMEGSDTMVNLAQSWAEEYRKAHADSKIEVSGGGSGQGINAIIEGVANMANASREMKPEELERAEQITGKQPKEWTVAGDALAVYVHKDNPLEAISLEEIAEIYGDGGQTTKWADLGVTVPGCDQGEIVRYGRQSNSGTYAYFRETVLGAKREFKLGSLDQSGSKEVVEAVAKNPCSIGYSGMGYATPEVKMLKISKKKGEEGVAPTIENAKNKTYPIARKLYIYTLGEPTGQVKQFLDWILSPAGQTIVADKGYVPND